ncbi:unnamed protein product [Cuscuta campestris]|uniref:CCHC-type domain-containing protein n=1 Tax=Cuscuta campestris TaxID=132261 RepID=A0A484MG06_9ASTE|nr:unnamed protein product [Cuscuta campestris]
MWDKLEITYEGTDQVREAKIDFLTHAYELFHMKENEKIDDMFEQFSKIVNDLHALKKTYTDKELVRKILRSLTPEWRSKAGAIQESIGITSVTIDGLRGNLKTYESTILYPSLGEQKKNVIALKASTSQERDVEDSSDKDEFGIVLKKFHKFMSQEYERKGKKQGSPPKCYGCGEVGHIKPKCPNAKNKKKMFKKHRAYISWGGDSGDESSEGEENESANLCLMAHEEPPEEISCCSTAKEMWDKLEVTYEGTDQVREAKIDFLTQEYEMFRMKEHENIDDMFDRFSKIVNDLHALKKTYTDRDLVRKILRSLTSEWQSKADAIYESIGTSTVTIDGLRDGFKAYADPHIIEGRTLKQDDIPVPVLELIQEQGRQGVSTYCKKGWITDSRDFNSDSCLRVLNNITLDHVFEDPHYFLRRPNVQDLPANRFILLKILKENVIPVLNKDKQVGVYECTLLYWLPTHKKINLPSIILKHMSECSGRQNKPYGMLLTHMFAKREILEVRPSRVRYLDAECLGYCDLVKIGEEYYMKKEFQNLDEATRAEYGPRRSMSYLPSTSRAPRAVAEENANTEVPVRAPRVKRSKLASHASSTSLLQRHSPMASTSKNPFKKFKKFILKTVVAPMRKLQESLDDLSDRMKKMEDRENRQKQNEDRASRVKCGDISTDGGEYFIPNNEWVVIDEHGIINLRCHASRQPTIHFAPPKNRLLRNIVSRILKPQDGSHTIMSMENLKLIYTIIHVALVNWAKFIMIHMTPPPSVMTNSYPTPSSSWRFLTILMS